MTINNVIANVIAMVRCSQTRQQQAPLSLCIQSYFSVSTSFVLHWKPAFIFGTSHPHQSSCLQHIRPSISLIMRWPVQLAERYHVMINKRHDCKHCTLPERARVSMAGVLDCAELGTQAEACRAKVARCARSLLVVTTDAASRLPPVE
jgi:hypothetical protein